MQLLWSFGLDAEYCHQVVPPRVEFWKWPVDFYNFEADFFVLVDGKHHWTGIHQYSSADIADKDMRPNMAAVAAGCRVVRVHTADLQNPGCVLAALVAARDGAAIVLTPSYAKCYTVWQGRKELYADVLQREGLPAPRRLHMTTAEHEICVFNPV